MSSAASIIDIGIIGSGFMGRTYAEVITKRLAGVARLVAVSGGSRATQLAADYGAEYLENWGDLCKKPVLDAVIVSSPHEHHATQSIAAALAGKHVMVEKPMAASVEDCSKIVCVASESGVHVGVAFTQRKRLCNKLAKEIIDSGTLGPPLHIQGWHVVGGGTKSLPGWQNTQGNIGVLLGHGIHLFDAVRWFTGREIDRIAAVCRNYREGYAVEASSDVLVEMEGGCRANLICSFETTAPGFPSTQFGFRITCERGLIDLDAYGSLRVSEGGAPFVEIARQAPIDWQSKGFLDPVRLESYTEHLAEFCESIRQSRDLGPSASDGLESVAAVFAAYESSETGRFVSPATLISPHQGGRSIR